MLSASAKPLQGSEAHSRKSALSLLALAATGAACGRRIKWGRGRGAALESLQLGTWGETEGLLMGGGRESQFGDSNWLTKVRTLVGDAAVAAWLKGAS